MNNHIPTKSLVPTAVSIALGGVLVVSSLFVISKIMGIPSEGMSLEYALRYPIQGVAFLLSMATLLGVGAVGGVNEYRMSKWSRAIREDFRNRYGIELTERAVDELKYPEGKPDSVEPISFGTTTVPSGSDALGRQLTLIWNSEQMALAERGCELKPLTARAPIVS